MAGSAFGFGSPITYPISQPIPFGLSPYGPFTLSASLFTSPQQYGQPLQQILQILQIVPQQLQHLQQLQYVQQQQLQHVQQLLQVVPAQLAQLQQLIQFVPQQIQQMQQPATGATSIWTSVRTERPCRRPAVGRRTAGLRPVEPGDVSDLHLETIGNDQGEQLTW